MPWTMTDNSLTWLEPTRKCNISCDACFSANDPQSEKPLRQIEAEIEAMSRLRRSDGMLIAGGEPLTHPRLIDIVKIVRNRGLKPVLLTNGHGLEPTLIRDLKKEGLFGFTFHVDSHQSRPGWTGKDERELNELRQHLADMVHEAGGLVCGFNMTVFPDTLHAVPDLVLWALRNVDRVQSYTVTALRMAEKDAPFDYYVGSRKIDIRQLVYYSPIPYEKLTSADLYSKIRQVIPDFKLCAYLGGTALSQSVKWAVGCRIASVRMSFGNLGRESMELLQVAHHLFTGRYLAFGKPGLNRRARLIFLLGFFDREVRRAFRNYLLAVLKDPLLLFSRLYVQSIVVEQPCDLLPTGELDICDGCPNKTFWRGRLVSACLLEEYLKYGAAIRPVPTGAAKPC